LEFAVLNGIVLIEHMRYLKQSGMKNIKELVFKATKERLRPVLLTASTRRFWFSAYGHYQHRPEPKFNVL
jgi:cobalt-zinc-cadmium resistance protein CzcA